MTVPTKVSPGGQRHRTGFTLVELLVVAAVITVLAGITAASVRSAARRANAIKCAATLKSLGTATLLYTQENQDQFPRSFHSAGAHRQPGWAASIAPYLGVVGTQIESDWPGVFNAGFRCPEDRTSDPFVYSYGFNVHFELDPDGDDYTGSPATWRRLEHCPAPAGTILIGETRPVRFGDHLMCHQWSGIQGAKNALNHAVHGGRANYLFLDGHVEMLRVDETFAPSAGNNRWNPSLAH